MARKRRDYAAEYARRQELARSRGFGGYYEQRRAGGPRAEPRYVEEPREQPRGGLDFGSPEDRAWEVGPAVPVERDDSAAFENALSGDDVGFVAIRGQYSGSIVAYVTYGDGSSDEFMLQSVPSGYKVEPSGQEAEYDYIESWADWMDDNDIEYDIEVSA
jgi:hypothetical protein